MSTAAITPHQLDSIVVASVTGDTPFPATAVWAQEKLGVGVPAFDVNAACAGFSYGLASATAFVQAGMADTVLLAGRRSSAGSSTSRTARPRSSSAMARAPRSSRPPTGPDRGDRPRRRRDGGRHPPDAGGRHARARLPCHRRRPRSPIRMPKGRGVQARGDRDGRRRRELLEKSEHTPADVDVLIPHQANARIMVAVAERLGVPAERSILDVAEVGNTSAASIPIALARAWNAAGSRRATSSCSPRSAPVSPGAQPWSGGRCRSPSDP